MKLIAIVAHPEYQSQGQGTPYFVVANIIGERHASRLRARLKSLVIVHNWAIVAEDGEVMMATGKAFKELPLLSGIGYGWFVDLPAIKKQEPTLIEQGSNYFECIEYFTSRKEEFIRARTQLRHLIYDWEQRLYGKEHNIAIASLESLRGRLAKLHRTFYYVNPSVDDTQYEEGEL